MISKICSRSVYCLLKYFKTDTICSVLYLSLRGCYLNLITELSLTFSSYSALGMLTPNFVSIPLQLLMHSKKQPRHWDNNSGSGLSKRVVVSTHVNCPKKKVLVTVVKLRQLESQSVLQEEGLQAHVEVIEVAEPGHAQLEEVKVVKQATLRQLAHQREHQKRITASCDVFLTCVPTRFMRLDIMLLPLQDLEQRMAIQPKLYVSTIFFDRFTHLPGGT